MNAPNIQELKVEAGGDLFSFLLNVPTSVEAQILYALMIGNVIGMLAHYWRGWATGEIAGCLVDYLFRQNTRRTWLTVFTVLSASVAEVATGLFVTDGGVFIGWALVIISGFKTGYMGDSLVNKGTRAVWSQDKREEQASKT